MTKLVKFGTFIRPPFDYGHVGADVADQAREAATRIRGHEKAAAVEIGRELIAMKEALGHGHFLPWLEAEFGYSARTAQNLMQIAAVFGDKYATIAHLPKAVQYALASPTTPDTIRQSVLNTAPGHYVSPAEVKVAIYKSRKPKPGRMTYEQREEQRREQAAQLARERDRAEQEREFERAKAQEAATMLQDRLGADYAALQAIVRETGPHALQDAILASRSA